MKEIEVTLASFHSFGYQLKKPRSFIESNSSKERIHRCWMEFFAEWGIKGISDVYDEILISNQRTRSDVEWNKSPY